MERRRTRVRSALAGHGALALKNGRIVNVFTGEILRADVAVRDGIIVSVGECSGDDEIDLDGAFVCPGFIDAHVHIESSMTTPAGFAQVAMRQGTTTAIADPHEIANVAGVTGVRYLMDCAMKLPMDIRFMMPSCVPCTAFETAGAVFDAGDMMKLMGHPRALGLGEVMDVGKVLTGDEGMLEKLSLFDTRPIDGHAPLLGGRDLMAYRVAGPSSDHECSNFEEVLEKLRAGFYIHLRVGSSANHMEAVFESLAKSGLDTRYLMFCTDDKHLEDIRAQGHIGANARMAVKCGIPAVEAVRMATINAATAYGLRGVGAVAPGYRADIAVFEDLVNFNPVRVYAAGKRVDRVMELENAPCPDQLLHSVHIPALTRQDFAPRGQGPIPVIEMLPGQLITRLSWSESAQEENLCKIAVVERHRASGRIGRALVRGFGLNCGAIASTVAHDSHNMVVLGRDEGDMLCAANALAACGGGYAVALEGRVLSCLPLPIGGLMSARAPEEVLLAQRELLKAARQLGADMRADPFIRLSFMALPVIPDVRVTDRGVYSLNQSRFISSV